MPMLTAIFVAHPRQVGESYLAHARTAGTFGLAMLAGGAACLVHAVVPALFTSTGSDTVRRLHRAMAARRREAAEGFCYCI